MQTSRGFYELAYTGEDRYNILYTDFASRIRTYLCARPECTHLDDTCTSQVPQGGKLAATDGFLYLFIPNRNNPFEPTCAQIHRIALDGSQREKIFEFESNESIYGAIASDQNSFYYLKSIVSSSGAVTYDLCSLDHNGTQENVLASYEGNVAIWGASGRSLLIKTIDAHEPEPGSGDEGWTQMFQTAQNSLTRFDVDSRKEETVYTWLSGEKDVTCGPDQLCILNYAQATFEILDLLGGEQKVLAEQIPTNAPENVNVGPVWDGRYTVEYAVNQGPGNIAFQYYNADLSAGGWNETTLLYDRYGEMREMRILAESESDFLVICGMKEVRMQYLLRTGEVETVDATVPAYAMIPQTAYWNGERQMTEIDDWVFPA